MSEENFTDFQADDEDQSFVFEDYTPKTPKENVQKRDDAQFQAEISALIQEGEDMRVLYMRKHRTRSLISMTLAIICLLAGGCGFGWFLLIKYKLTPALLSIFCTIIPTALGFWWSQGPIKSYKRAYKTVFMPRLAKALGGLRFHPKRGIPAKILAKTRIMPAFKRYEAEDCFLGRYNDVKVIMSEARLYLEKKGGTPVFRGLMVMLESPKQIFEGHTIITANRDMATQWATSQWKGLTPVHVPVSDAKWGRFQIFSSKPEIAIKTTGEKLLKELSETVEVFDDAPLSAVLFGGKFIFLMIPYKTDMFEASSIYIPITTADYAQRCKQEVDRIIEIIDVFEIYKGR